MRPIGTEQSHFGDLEGKNLEKVCGRIRIPVRIRQKGRIRIRISEKQDPDSHLKQDSDPLQRCGSATLVLSLRTRIWRFKNNFLKIKTRQPLFYSFDVAGLVLLHGWVTMYRGKVRLWRRPSVQGQERRRYRTFCTNYSTGKYKTTRKRDSLNRSIIFSDFHNIWLVFCREN